MPIGTILVCNDARAQEMLLRLLSADTEFSVLGHIRHVDDALSALPGLRPDVVFLDLDLLDSDSASTILACAEVLGAALVFLSGSEDCVRRTFEAGAIDGLVKPLTEQRIREAALRVRYEMMSRNGMREKAPVLPEHMASTDRTSGKKESEPIIVRAGARVLFLRPEDVVWVQAAANYLRFHTASGMHVVRGKISALENYLESRRFLRVHRSVIVNTEWLKELVPCGHGEYVLRLTNGRELPIGRCYQERIEAFLSCCFSARAR